MSFWNFFKLGDRTQGLHSRGIADLKQRKYKEAIVSFDKVIAREPDNFVAFCYRGECYEFMGLNRYAFDDYESALKLSPKHGRTLYYRGRLYLRLKEYSKAVADFTLAIENQYDALYLRCLAYMQVGLPELALDDVSEVIRRGTMTAGLLVTRANCYHRMDRTKEAIDDLLKAIDIDERNATANNNLAWYYATSHWDDVRNGAKAVEHALKALGNQKSPHPAYIGTLAAAYAEMGKFKEAVDWATKFLESSPPPETIADARQRLELYQMGKPYREKPGQFSTVGDNRPRKS